MSKLVEFEADKTRSIKFGINSLIRLEKEMGNRPLTSLSTEEFKIEDLRTILHVGLSHEDKELTLEKTGDIIDEAIEKNGMNYVSQKLAESLQKAFGNADLTPISH